MGMQGSSRAIARGEAAGQSWHTRFAYIMCPLVLGTLLAACSSLAALFPGPNQPVTVSQTAGASAQPVSMTPAPIAKDQAASVGPYPTQSLVDYFREDSAPASPAPAIRSVATAPPSAGAAPSVGPYTQQSLSDYFRGSTSSTQTANVPHPPSTYTPAGQPYVPPSGQLNYVVPQPPVQPAPATQAAAAPPPPPAPTGPYPSQSIFDIFSNNSGSQ